MTAERDRLALLIAEMRPDLGESAPLAMADRLIAAGWTDLPVERLARALHRSYCHERRPMHSDPTHSAAAIAAAYREDAGSPLRAADIPSGESHYP